MANFFTKALQGLTTKGSTFSMQSHNTDRLSIVGNFFGWLLGKRGYEQYTEAYGDNPLVYMVVNRISTTTASLKRIVQDANGEQDDNSSIYAELPEPNSKQTWQDFYEVVYEYLLLTGNTYIREMKSLGDLGSYFEVLVTKNTEIVAGSAGEVIGYKYTKPDGSVIPFIPAEEVLHIKTSNVVNVDDTNISYGLSPLQAAWIVVQSSSEKLKAEASIFKNRGIVGMLTNNSDQSMLPQERERLQEEFDKEAGGAEKFNRVKISTQKLNYIQMGMSPTDLKLLEGILQSLRMICSVYGISSVLFNDNENSTYNNVAEAKKDAFITAYLPLAKKVDTKLSIWLSEKLNLSTPEHITVDLSSIEEIAATTNEMAQRISNLSPLLGNRILEVLTVDEIRELVEAGALPDSAIGSSLAGAGSTTVNASTDG
jgi:HK97 family phage portal protein